MFTTTQCIYILILIFSFTQVHTYYQINQNKVGKKNSKPTKKKPHIFCISKSFSSI
eukprot:UN10805